MKNIFKINDFINITSECLDVYDSNKVVLSNDPNLIADGVQSIDDEFLEWFVKNPSCEVVDVKEDKYRRFISKDEGEEWVKYNYVEPPQEEPKQTDWKESTKLLMEAYGDDPKDFPYEEPKQETLEEAAENYANKKGHIPTTGLEDAIFKQGFLDGAKWQDGRMYSEKDMISFMQFIISNPDLGNTSSVSKTTAKYYLEQYKKK
jgi:hypothetical protein